MRETERAEERTDGEIDLRELGRAAAVAALGLAIPWAFHLVRLGQVFLPMYLPLLVGAFLLRPRTACAAAAVTPLLSSLVTGMPPLYPPVAGWMAVELGAMAALASLLHRRTGLSRPAVLVVVLLVGRGLHAALAYGTSLLLDLPAAPLTLLSLFAGWPGMVLVLLVVPPTAAALERALVPDLPPPPSS